jgi:DNA-binding FrmR family transcriptional regulator
MAARQSSRQSAGQSRASRAAEPAQVAPQVAVCACGTDATDGAVRKAVAVDPDIKARNLTRLRRIEGQVRGLQKMVDEERYCTDVLVQIASVHEALRSVGRALMRNHLKHCATRAIRTAGPEADAMYDELVDLIYTHSR